MRYRTKILIIVLLLIGVGCVSIKIMTKDDDTKTGVKTEVHKLDSIK